MWSSMKNKIRPTGYITQDLELLLEELIDQHQLQHGEVLALVDAWITIHRPDAKEEYQDGTNPIYYYGPKEVKNV